MAELLASPNKVFERKSNFSRIQRKHQQIINEFKGAWGNCSTVFRSWSRELIMKTINEMISISKLNIGPKLVTNGESPSDGCMCKVPIQSSERGCLYVNQNGKPVDLGELVWLVGAANLVKKVSKFN